MRFRVENLRQKSSDKTTLECKSERRHLPARNNDNYEVDLVIVVRAVTLTTKLMRMKVIAGQCNGCGKSRKETERRRKDHGVRCNNGSASN